MFASLSVPVSVSVSVSEFVSVSVSVSTVDVYDGVCDTYIRQRILHR